MLGLTQLAEATLHPPSPLPAPAMAAHGWWRAPKGKTLHTHDRCGGLPRKPVKVMLTPAEQAGASLCARCNNPAQSYAPNTLRAYEAAIVDHALFAVLASRPVSDWEAIAKRSYDLSQGIYDQHTNHTPADDGETYALWFAQELGSLVVDLRAAASALVAAGDDLPSRWIAAWSVNHQVANLHASMQLGVNVTELFSTGVRPGLLSSGTGGRWSARQALRGDDVWNGGHHLRDTDTIKVRSAAGLDVLEPALRLVNESLTAQYNEALADTEMIVVQAPAPHDLRGRDSLWHRAQWARWQSAEIEGGDVFMIVPERFVTAWNTSIAAFKMKAIDNCVLVGPADTMSAANLTVLADLVSSGVDTSTAYDVARRI